MILDSSQCKKDNIYWENSSPLFLHKHHTSKRNYKFSASASNRFNGVNDTLLLAKMKWFLQLHLIPVDCISFPLLCRVIYLPPRSWKYMLVLFIPMPLYNFPSMWLILLYSSISNGPHIFMDIKVKKRSTLSPRFVYNQLIETVLLTSTKINSELASIQHIRR